MPAHATALSAATGLITDAIALDPLAVDALLTFGLAGMLVVAAVVVLAMLPWTDQQIEEVDAEARRLAGGIAAELAPRVPTLSSQLRAGLAGVGGSRR